jgi:hypothetical protein
MDELKTIVITAVVGLVVTGFIALLNLWRDSAVMKRDLDALAEIIGTDRAKGRCNKKSKKET